jgi:hypothetical protein
MASLDFSEEFCEQLFKVPKYLASRISWKQMGNFKFVCQAKVLAEDGTGLDLFGYWVKSGRHNRSTWGFTLSYFGNCVRTYDRAKYHRNPGMRGKIRGPHKHRFSSSKIPRFAYTPEPPIAEGNPNLALLDFLTEAHIELRGDYQHFMFP